MSFADKIRNCSYSFSDECRIIRDPKGDSKSAYNIYNSRNAKYDLIKFDGCVFDDSIEKCDYGMEINNIIHFVELKGAKNNKGLSQLLKSIQETEDIYSNHEKKVRLIVSKRKAPQFIDGKSTRQIGLLIGSPLDDESQNFIIKEKYFTEYIN